MFTFTKNEKELETAYEKLVYISAEMSQTISSKILGNFTQILKIIQIKSQLSTSHPIHKFCQCARVRVFTDVYSPV